MYRYASMASALILFWSTLAGCADAPTGVSDPVNPIESLLAGSHNLKITSSVFVQTGIPGVEESAALNREMRLDVFEDDNGHWALLSPRWGFPKHYEVRTEDGIVSLHATGGRAGFSSGRYGGESHYAQIDVIHFDGLAGSASFAGTEEIFVGDVGDFTDISGQITYELDSLAPEARFENGRREVLLPWEDVVVDLAEPTAESGIVDHFSAPSEFDLVTLADGAKLSLVPQSWWPAGDADVQLQAGYSDFNGNTGALINLDKTVPELPSAQSVLDFAGGLDGTFVHWGNLGTYADGEYDCTSTSGQCLALYPGSLRCSGQGASGILVRLAPSEPAASIEVRLRFAADEPATVFSVGHAVTLSAGAVGAVNMAQHREGHGGGVGSWQNVVIDLDAPASDIVVAIDFDLGFCAANPAHDGDTIPGELLIDTIRPL